MLSRIVSCFIVNKDIHSINQQLYNGKHTILNQVNLEIYIYII